jgi:hypothetical protein
MTVGQVRKAVVAALGAVLEAGAEIASRTDLLPAAWQPWARLLIAVAVVVGVYQVPNATPAPGPAAARAGLHRP